MKSWPHAPSRAVCGPGSYFVTAGTLYREQFFRGHERLTHLEDSLLELAEEFGWKLEAWAVFVNHYHFVGNSPDSGSNLRKFTNKLHGTTARWVNKRDACPGRTVWYSYRQVKLTYERSYVARLNYVHRNAVHHGLVKVPEHYPYCSAEWFFQRADPAWYHTVSSFPIDRLEIEGDDFPIEPDSA